MTALFFCVLGALRPRLFCKSSIKSSLLGPFSRQVQVFEIAEPPIRPGVKRYLPDRAVLCKSLFSV